MTMTWAGNVTWERREMHTKSKSQNLKGGDNLGDIGVDGRIILKYISKI
jgi:hypothetical protein